MRSRSASAWYALTFSRMSFSRIISAARERTPSQKCQQTPPNALRRAVPPPDSPFVVRGLTHPAGGSYARRPMVTCPACGKENEDAASECKRCRAPLREEEPLVEDISVSESLGEVCRGCEAYNEPGVTACTNCGAPLFESGDLPHLTPPLFTPATQAPETLSQELRALAISEEEAAEAGLTMPARGASSGAGLAAAPLPPRPPPAPAPPARAFPAAMSIPAEKPCASCGALNPPAA